MHVWLCKDLNVLSKDQKVENSLANYIAVIKIVMCKKIKSDISIKTLLTFNSLLLAISTKIIYLGEEEAIIHVLKINYRDKSK